MKRVLFYELDSENRLTAIGQMLSFKKSNGYPCGAVWRDEDELVEDLGQGYDPDEHFTFYVDEYGEVETKIG